MENANIDSLHLRLYFSVHIQILHFLQYCDTFRTKSILETIIRRFIIHFNASIHLHNNISNTPRRIHDKYYYEYRLNRNMVC